MDPYTGEVYAEATYPSYDANDYRAIAADGAEPVHRPGRLERLRAGFRVQDDDRRRPPSSRGRSRARPRIKDVGTLRLDNGQSKIDNADHQGMGWITFEDGIAYSRNVVAAKVALGLSDTTNESAAMLYDTWRKLGFGEKTGIDVAGEASGNAYVRDPAVTPWSEIDLANGAFGQGVAVTPIQLATAYAALVNGGTLVQPHVVSGVGSRDVTASRPGSCRPREDLADPPADDGSRRPGGAVLPRPDAGARLPRRWQDRHRPDLGSPRPRSWKHNLFNFSFVGYIGREAGAPDLVVAVRIEEGRPRLPRLGHLEMPVMSFELFRRIATDAITTPDLLDDRIVAEPVPATDR